MTDDLVTKVLAAIEETERIARAAIGKLTGAWAVEPFEPSRPEAVPASAWVDDGDEGVAMVNGSYRAAHIARQDPQATLLRCEADREIVEDYQEATRKVERAAVGVQIMRGHGAAEEAEAMRRLLIAQVKQTTLYEVIERLARVYDIEVTTSG